MTPEELERRALDAAASAAAMPAADRDAYLHSVAATDPTLATRAAEILEHAADPATVFGAGHPASPPAPWCPPFIGGCRVLRVVGTGGMGVVFEAEQGALNRRVAIKALRPGSVGPDALRRFDVEAAALARLGHPGIAKIHGTGVEREGSLEYPYFIMEFVDGRTLTDHARAERLTVHQRAALIAQVCDAVHHAHQRGVIHRDLKPGNVLVGRDGQVRVVDFGVARLLEGEGLERATLTGQVVGTPTYMSPEQAAGDGVIDTRTDVYALGALLFETLAARPPYQVAGLPLDKALRLIREEEPARLGHIDRSLRGDLELITATAMSKDRERRYPSASEMAADLRRYLENFPIAARPAGLAYRVGKLYRRNRAAFAALSVCALTLVAGASFTSWFAWKEAKAHAATEKSLSEARKQREAAEEMTAFLQELLAEPSAGRGGRDARVVDMLDRASARLDTQPPRTPAAEAALQDSLASAYTDLGEYAAAEKHIRKAIDLNMSVFGPDDSRTFRSRELFARLLGDTGRHRESEQIHREMLANALALGADTGNICQLKQELSVSLIRQFKYQEALDLLNGALEQALPALGPNDRVVLAIQSGLGSVLIGLMRYDEAAAILEPTLTACEQHTGRDSTRTMDVMNMLAAVKMSQGKGDEAIAIRRDLVDRATSRLGPTTRGVIVYRANLATTLVNQRRYEEGDAEFSRLLAEAEPVFGAKSETVIYLRGDLARSLALQGRVEEYVSAMLSLCNDAAEVLPPTHAKLGLYQRECGAGLDKLGRLDEAELWLLRGYQTLHASLGDSHRATQVAIQQLADLYDRLNNQEKADEFRAKLIAPPTAAEPTSRTP